MNLKGLFGPILARLLGVGVGYVASTAAMKYGIIATPEQQAAATVAVYGVVHHALPKIVPALADVGASGTPQR